MKSKANHKERQLHEARNNYILSLNAFNSLQKLYDEEDLPLLMSKIDGSVYSLLKEILEKFATFEQEFAKSVQTSALATKMQASIISRETDVSTFLADNSAIFHEGLLLSFERTGSDVVQEIVVDDITKVSLGQKLGHLIAADTELSVLQETKEKELKGAQQLVDLYTNDPQTGNPTSPVELLQDVENSLVIIKCQRTKFIEQMDILRHLKSKSGMIHI